jgi:hypothetical protein
MSASSGAAPAVVWLRPSCSSSLLRAASVGADVGAAGLEAVRGLAQLFGVAGADGLQCLQLGWRVVQEGLQHAFQQASPLPG